MPNYAVDGPPPPDLSSLRPVFLTLHVVGGHVFLPIVIATCVLSKNTVHHPTVINLFCTWALYSISACLVLYSGKAVDATVTLCHVQSALMHGTLPMCATSSLIVVCQVWSMFRFPELGNARGWNSHMVIKLAIPYIIFLIFTIITGVLQTRLPEYVHAANGLYCTFYQDPFRRYGFTIFCSTAAVLMFGFELAIAIRYLYMWRQISLGFPLANRTISPTLVLRLTLFNVYSIISVGAGVTFVAYNTSLPSWPFMIQAGSPLVIALAFGTSKDLFLAWCFWKRKRKPEAGQGSSTNDLSTPHGLLLDSPSDFFARTRTIPSLMHRPEV